MPAPSDDSVGAAIDVGSTSVHLLVARVGWAAGVEPYRDVPTLDPLIDESVLLGLGQRVVVTGELGREGIVELVETLERYVAVSLANGVISPAIVATDPLRRASDTSGAVDEVARRLRRRLHVLTPDEEALLTLLGVTGGRRPIDETAVLDVGGGSTEVIVIGPDRAPETVSVPIGAIRLAAAFVAHDPPTADEIGALRVAAREALETVPLPGIMSLVGVGGTATNLGRVAAATMGRDVDQADVLTLDDVEAVLRRLAVEPVDAIAAAAGIRPGRARVLPAGAAILEAVLQRAGLSALTLSHASLREGLVRAQFRAGEEWRARLPEVAAGWA